MTDLKAIKDDLVFGLDIGTRSIECPPPAPAGTP